MDITKLNKEERLELLEVLEQKNKREATKSYLNYVQYVHGDSFKKGKHITYLANQIEQFIEGSISKKILLLSLPPQHGKSMLITETLPSYMLGKYPNKRVIAVSYGDDLASRFGKRNKEKIEQYGKELFNIELSKDSRSNTEFDISGHRGSMLSRGIMAGITGQSADLIIVDDPIKNRAEADSETYRNKVWDEWLNSILTRLSAYGKIIVIQTRWHEDDLIGRIIKHNSDDCLYINIPCEAEENDILGRNVGEALFPEIGKDNIWLQGYKKNYLTEDGNRAWLALFQGKPSAIEGNMLKRDWWQKYIKLPTMALKIISVDATFKNTKNSDFVAIQVWGKVGLNMYLIDRIKQRMDFPTTLQAIKDMKAKYPEVIGIYIEDKANGSAIIQTLNMSISGIIPVTPKESKEARVSAISPQIESKHVYLPDYSNAPWIEEFISECCKFPNGAFDDDVDCMSQAILKLKDMFAELIESNPNDEDHVLIDDQISEFCKCI